MNKIEEYIQKYPSVKNWFLKPNDEKRYKPSTEKQYIEYMKIFCRILKMNPDIIIQRIKTSPVPKDQIFNMKLKIGNQMKARGLAERSIHQRLHAFHAFLRANEITVDMEDFIKRGPFWVQRLKKWRPRTS